MKKVLSILLLVVILTNLQAAAAFGEGVSGTDGSMSVSNEETAKVAEVIAFSSDNIEIKKGTTQQLPEIIMDGAGTVEWVISDESIVSIDQSKGTMTAHTFGNVTLLAYLQQNDAVFAITKVTVIPNNAGLKVYEGTITERFAALKEQFPHQKYWNNYENMGQFDPNGYTDKACTTADHKALRYCGHFAGGVQCWGFADRIAYGLFGSYPDSWTAGEMDSNGWLRLEDKSVVNYLEPGDWVRIKHTNGEHSFVVWKISGSSVYCVEANWSGRCMIQWGKVRSISSIKSNLLFVQKHPESQYKEMFIGSSASEETTGEVLVEYEIIDGEAWITGVDWNGNKEWNVEDEYNGYPVVGMDIWSWANYRNLKVIHLGANIREVSSLYWTENITEYTVSEDNPYFCAVDGVIYTKDMKTLLEWPEALVVESFTIPEGVEEIESYVYAEEIIVPSTVSAGVNYLDGSSVMEIEISEDNPYFCSIDGIAYTKDMKTLLAWPGARSVESFSVPEGVEMIDSAIRAKTTVLPSTFKGSFYYVKRSYDISEIKVSENNPHYCAVDGVVYTKDMKTLLVWPYALKTEEFAMPEGVEEIDCIIGAKTIVLSSTFRSGTGYLSDSQELLEIEVVAESSSFTAKEGMLFTKDEKQLLVVPENKYRAGYVVIPDGTTKYTHSYYSYEYPAQIVAPSSLEMWNGWLEGETIILNGCKLTMSDRYNGTGEVDYLIFLNHAEIEMVEDNEIDARYVYAPKGSFGEQFASDYGATFIELEMTISQSELELDMMQSQNLSVSMPYMAEAGITAEWKSADPTIAMVNRHGKVTAISCGETVITASIGEITAECRVTVTPADGIRLAKLPAALKMIESESFSNSDVSYVVCPEGLENISANAFKNCAELSWIVIPGMNTEIHSDAFSGCSDELVIVAKSGSKAHQFALTHGYQYLVR